MPRIKSPISGIIRNTPDSDADMGSAQELINLRFKDNAWRAIGKKNQLGTEVNSTNKLIGWYHHPSNNDSVFVTFDNTSKKIIVVDSVNDTLTVVKKRNGDDFVLPSGELFNCFTHLENVLVLLGTADRYNFLWINGVFEFIEFGGIDWTCEKGSESQIDILTDGITYETSVDGLNIAWNSLLPVAVGDYIQKRSEAITAGYIEGICAFRLAIELFDGTFCWYSDIKILRATGINKQTSFTHTVPSSVPCLFENTYYPDIIGFANVVAAYVKLLKFTKYMPVIQYQISDALKYYFRNKTIKAIHVCATKPIYPKISSNINDYWTSYISDSDGRLAKRYNMKAEIAQVESLFLSELSNFKSIFSTTLENGFKTPSLTEVFSFSNFESNMDIPTDNFTGNKTSAKYAFIYNKRLHLQQISNSLPSLGNISNDYSFMFEKYVTTSGYSVYFDIVITINNQFFVTRKMIDFDLWKKWITFSPQLLDNNSVYISREVYYNHSSCNYCRLSFSKDGVNFYKLKVDGSIDMINIPNLNLSKAKIEANQFTNNGIFYDYSDKNTTDTQKEWWQYDNMRFLTLKVPTSGVDYATHNSCELCTELPATYIDTNRVQLSETSNPLVLPALNSYRFGDINNLVNGVEVAREQLSETRFGQFPLYVFTLQGIFALEQGTGSVAYASTNFIDKYVVKDHECIKAIKGFVVFRTDSGYYVISGRQIQEISTQLEGKTSIECVNDLKYNELLQLFEMPQTKIISDSNPLLINDLICSYDFINSEIFFTPRLLPIAEHEQENGFSYIYDLLHKKWTKSSECFSYFIDISPNIVCVKEFLSENQGFNYSFYDLHSENQSNELKLFVSRPITFGSKAYKRINNFISRLYVYDSHSRINPVKLYLYGSIDGIEYKLIQGFETTTKVLQDQEIRRVFIDFKYLQIVLGFTHRECEVIGFETDVNEKFNNKLR